MSLESKIKAYLGSDSGTAKLKGEAKRLIKGGGRNGGGSGVNGLPPPPDDIIESLINLVVSEAGELPESVKKDVLSLSVISIDESDDVGYTVSLGFSGDLSRWSLYPEKYGLLDNIVALFNNGYVAQDYVYGGGAGEKYDFYKNKKGKIYARSRLERPGLHFMNNAVNKFNSQYGSRYCVEATLSDDYE